MFGFGFYSTLSVPFTGQTFTLAVDFDAALFGEAVK